MATYKPLQSLVLTAAPSSVTFSGIDQGYTDLVLVCNFGEEPTNASYGFYLQFNGDTGTNYSSTNLLGNGTTASSTRASTASFFRISGYGTGTANTLTNIAIANIMDYANSTTHKTTISRSSIASLQAGASVGLWRSTSAITSITITAESQNLSAGSTFDLYGIKSGAPKAFGGDLVTTDGNYWYHTFRSSGTFLLQQPTSVDYLVVAGGGSGGSYGGGGGGAGGMRCTVTGTGGSGSVESALSLSPNSYTITVGAGGAATPTPAGQGYNGSNSVFSTITSTGGGGGGGSGYNVNGSAGGSGGGASAGYEGAGTGGSASPSGQGYAGGGTSGAIPNLYGRGSGGGGGGGASIDGQSVNNHILVAGNGGNGRATSISGASVTYAGGGGGASATGGSPSATGVVGTGGSGGGGAGGFASGSSGVSGTANTGGGGGGSWYNGSSQGGSGIVIVRYPV